MFLPSWNATPTKQAILKFVAKATALGGPDYIPPTERIAAFDNDGTLWNLRKFAEQHGDVIQESSPIALAFFLTASQESTGDSTSIRFPFSL